MRATLSWFGEDKPQKPDHKYTVTGRCPQCGREHVTIFRLRHLSDSLFGQLGRFFQYAAHETPDGATCENSGKSPEWGGPAKLP